ncbi:hypothetical protein PROFUN_04184 [Planoprotostelium fungivorum]|uniref:Protein kinase domain-containing protein n=1 Tax=Planoprotostelium fungivorum TaxID=1890364 RepID=A0A2P6NVU9_9EUKA|nr:hypothetical protein PROFUN_04184 [Planoprotostelium fungivorum]
METSLQDDISTIQRRMGVCPQSDVLWPELTAFEHVRIIHMIQSEGPTFQCIDILKNVDLHEVKLVSGQFSGGMKRRLQVAMSIVGNPSLLIMDEPTTGMDPVNRRRVWNLLKSIREDKLIVLTTHAMEEAEVLGEKIAILSQGSVLTVGNSLHLKNKYAVGYRLQLIAIDDRSDEVIDLILSTLPSAHLTEKSGSSIVFAITSTDEDEIGGLLQTLQNEAKREGESPLRDWGLSSSTLEDVFLQGRDREWAAKVVTTELLYRSKNVQKVLFCPQPWMSFSRCAGVDQRIHVLNLLTLSSAPHLSSSKKGFCDVCGFGRGEANHYRHRPAQTAHIMRCLLLVILSCFFSLVDGRRAEQRVGENPQGGEEYTAEANSSVLLLVAGLTVTLLLIVLYILKVATETDGTVYSTMKSPENEVELKVVKDGEGATSDNEPRSDTSVAYASPAGEAKVKEEERWRQIFSIPTVFAGAVLFFIAVIAISTTLLSFFAQRDMVDDLTGQIQNSISTSFLSQTNATLNDYTQWGKEVKMFASYYIPPGSPIPDANKSSLIMYPDLIRYMLSATQHREAGVSCGITFSNSKSFGAGHEVYGANVYDTFNISGSLYTWVTLLNANLSLDYPQPDPHPVLIIPVQYYDLTAAPCPTGYPTEFWGPLKPTITGPTEVENSLIRFIRTCYQEQLTFLTIINIKFGTISSLLQQMVSQVKGKAFIVETNGAIVASTTGTHPYLLTPTGDTLRYFANNCSDQYIHEAWDIYQKDPSLSQTTHTIDGVNYFLLPTHLNTGDGISWIIVHLAESDPFLARINVYVRRTGIIIGVVCAAAVILAILASFWITRPFTRLTRQLQKAAKMQLTEKEVSVPFLFEARRIHQAFITMREAMKSFQRYIPEALIKTRMDYKELRNLVEVGAGAFGVVFSADWNNEIVAVKQVKAEFVSDLQMQDFLSEVSILQALPAHPNVVLFKAATFPPQPLSMITEFCGGGSLYAYVRKYPNLALPEKLRLLTEIAKGMHHLHKQKVVHRDLALRNILLSSELQAKVSDFGMSRVNASGDGSTTTANVGPLKWMPPEAISQSKYSTKSDVFSFSILIWELFEEKDPYPGLSPVEAAVHVVDGLRPVFTQCPPWLVSLAEACWSFSPEARPSFKRITQAIALEGLTDTREEEDEEAEKL